MTAATAADRVIRIKANSSRKWHAVRMGRAPLELRDTFGWTVADMAHDIAFHLANGCKYCRRPFASGDLAALTVDIIDPGRLPYWATNTAIVCMDCNRRKAGRAPDEWEARRNGKPEQLKAFDS